MMAPAAMAAMAAFSGSAWPSVSQSKPVTPTKTPSDSLIGRLSAKAISAFCADGNGGQDGLGWHHREQVLAGSFDKLLDIHFGRFLFILLAGLIFFHASHSRDVPASRLLRERCAEVTGFDLV